jgi:hypothetical protein
VPSTNICHFLAANTSAFRLLVHSGSRAGAVYANGSGVTKFFPYTALAGQEVDLGNIPFNTGDLKIEPKYLGQTLDQINTAYEFDIYVDGLWRTTLRRNYSSSVLSSSITLVNLSEGTHTVAYSMPYVGQFGSHSVSVTQGTLTTDGYDLSAQLGVIKGNLLVNGAPPTVASAFGVCGVPSTNICHFLGANTSAFRLLVHSGSRAGAIYANGSGVIKFFPYTALAGQEVIVGDPFQLNLVGTLTGKSGPFNARVWQYTLKNLDSGAVSPTVSAFSLTQTFGTTCTPVVNTVLPVQYPLLAQNASASSNFTLDLSSCAANARFTLNVTAASGATTQSFSHTMQFR